jgi:hypothetical protein
MRRRTTTRRSPARKAPVRRRRISGVGKSNVIMSIAGLAGGAILARLANNIILKAKPDLNSKIINAAQIGLGIYLPKLVKSQLGKDLGSGMIAAGGLGLATSLGVINGIDMVSGVNDEFVEMEISGMDDNLTTIAGYGDSEYGDDFGLGQIDMVSGVNDLDDEYNY